MKTIYIVGLLVLALSSAAALSMRSRWQKPSKPIGTNKMSFYDLTVNAIDGKVMNMADYKGKYVLCVNVASKCGYTPQYEDLEKLYEQYQGKLVIIGFPCNQFLGQEPGTSEEIVSFCQKKLRCYFSINRENRCERKESTWSLPIPNTEGLKWCCRWKCEVELPQILNLS